VENLKKESKHRYQDSGHPKFTPKDFDNKKYKRSSNLENNGTVRFKTSYPVSAEQVEVYKKQVGELNAKLSSEAERADRIAFDNAKLMEKLEALSVERDRLVIERDALREINEEMKILQEVRASLPEFLFSFYN